MPDSETQGWGPYLAAESLHGLRAPGSSRLNFSKTKGELGGPKVLEGVLWRFICLWLEILASLWLSETRNLRMEILDCQIRHLLQPLGLD